MDASPDIFLYVDLGTILSFISNKEMLKITGLEIVVNTILFLMAKSAGCPTGF